MSDELREALSDVSHEIWSHWMRYLFTTLDTTPECGAVIPHERLSRWHRQMHTPYNELTEAEKDSDREQADKILAVLERSAKRA